MATKVNEQPSANDISTTFSNEKAIKLLQQSKENKENENEVMSTSKNNSPSSAETVDLEETEEDDNGTASVFDQIKSPLHSVKKTIKSRSQMLREDRTSKILSPILRNWQTKPSPFDKIKSSVKKINEKKQNEMKSNVLTTSNKPPRKPEHFWDDGNFEKSEDSTFSGFR